MSYIELDLNLKNRIANPDLVEWGRKEINLAEKEMPGLMAIRRKYGVDKPLKGFKVTGSLT